MLSILLAALAAANFVAADAPPRACLAGKRQALIDSGFTGPLVCSENDATFKLVGRPSGSKYSVYDYRYHFLPHPGGVMHGGQKLVVFRGGKYIGQYALSPPPYTSISVSGSDIVLQSSASHEKVRLDLANRPPATLTVNGETDTFHR